MSSSCTDDSKFFIDETSFTLMNGIEKSVNDPRDMDHYVLDNGIRVFAIHDELCEPSLCSISIGAGSFQDPEDCPGLAHFVEHLLFMGTEKYPKPESYLNFLESHGGSRNGTTSSLCTNFFFNIINEFYEDCIDRFSSFFKCPLFDEHCIEKEINAVNNENSRNIMSSAHLARQIYRLALNQKHPISHFSTGNKDTLNIPGIRERVIQFYNDYYTPDNMCLVLYSNLSLDEIKRIAKQYFEGIQSHPCKIQPLDTDAVPDDCGTKLYRYIPIGNNKELFLTWMMPPQEYPYSRGSLQYVSLVLGHEHDKSLAYFLKHQNYITELYTSVGTHMTFGTRFDMSLTLTEKGYSDWSTIVHYIYEYVHYIQQQGPQEYFYKENHALSNLSFRYYQRSTKLRTIAAYSSDMLTTPIQYILHEDTLFREYNRGEIQRLFDYITPQHCVMLLADPLLDPQTVTIERYFKGRYRIDTIEDSLLESWSRAALTIPLTIPPPNPYIPTNLEVLESNSHGDETIAPSLVVDTPDVHMYLKNETPFNVPKLCLSVYLRSPYLQDTVKHMLLTSLWIDVVCRQLESTLYFAACASLTASFSSFSIYGITININGYNDHVSLLLRMIVEALRSPFIPQSELKDLVEQQADHLRMCIVTGIANQINELVCDAQSITMEDIQEHAKLILSSCYIDGLTTGNADKSDLDVYTAILEEYIPFNKDLNIHGNRHLDLPRILNIEPGNKYIYPFISPNPNEVSSAVFSYIHIGDRLDLPLYVKSVLFDTLFSSYSFGVLRTKEQLGYSARARSHVMRGEMGISTIVQSDKYSPWYIYTRILAFWREIKAYMSTISEKQFEETKVALKKTYLRKQDTLSQVHGSFSAPIARESFLFNKKFLYCELLDTITLEDIYTFYDIYIDPDSEECRYFTLFLTNQNVGYQDMPNDDSYILIPPTSSYPFDL
ncbi:hypothetical protein WA158_004126 [Blastocystis sp. Blastoise]